jgi:hypothetical protein
MGWEHPTGKINLEKVGSAVGNDLETITVYDISGKYTIFYSKE